MQTKIILILGIKKVYRNFKILTLNSRTHYALTFHLLRTDGTFVSDITDILKKLVHVLFTFCQLLFSNVKKARFLT